MAVETPTTPPTTSPTGTGDENLPDLAPDPNQADGDDDLGMSQVVSPADDGVMADPDAELALSFFEAQARERTGKLPSPENTGVQPPVAPGPTDPAAVPPTQPAATPPGVVTPPAPPTGTQPTVPPGQAAPGVPGTEQPGVSGQPAAAATATAPPPDSFRALHAELESHKPQVIDALAVKQYGLSQEDLDQLTTEPEKVIPRLLAKAHVAITQGVLAHLSQQMPVEVMRVAEVHRQQSQLEDAFYQQWPQLDRGQHGQLINQLAYTFRQLNPQANASTMMQMVGAQAVVALGLQNQAPAAQAPSRVPVRQPAYRPAAPGRASAPPQTGADVNQWTRMAAYIAADDAGLFEPGG